MFGKWRIAVRWSGALVVLALLASTAVVGASGAGGLKTGQTIYYIPKDTLNPYEVIADHGGLLALNEIGDKQVVSSGTQDTAAAQQPSIQAAIQTNAAGIVIAGNDPEAVCPALKQAMASPA